MSDSPTQSATQQQLASAFAALRYLLQEFPRSSTIRDEELNPFQQLWDFFDLVEPERLSELLPLIGRIAANFVEAGYRANEPMYVTRSISTLPLQWLQQLANDILPQQRFIVDMYRQLLQRVGAY